MWIATLYQPHILLYNIIMKQEELYEAIGYIRAKVENIELKVNSLDKKFDEGLANIDHRVDKVENIVSKIIGYATGAGAVAGIIIAFGRDYILQIFKS